MLSEMRGHNEGTVYQMPNGKWRAAVSLTGGRRISRVAASRAAALRELPELRRLRDAGVRSPQMTLGSFLEQWVSEVTPTVAPKTAKEYAGIVERGLIPGLGAIKLIRLTVPDVRNYLTGLALHPQTVQHHRAVLRTALRSAERDGLVTRNVAALAVAPAVPHRERAYLDAGQMQRLFEVTRPDRLHAAWVVLGTTGLREAELLGLAWTDVDWKGPSLTIRHTLQRIDGEWQLRPPKTGTSRRTVMLTRIAVVALRLHRARQRREQAAAGKLGRMGLVFTTAHGQPIHGSFLVKDLHRALERAGLPKVGVHGLRHSVASVLLAEGVPMRVIADLLGHSTVRITSDLYAHVSAPLQREAADVMQRRMAR